MRISGPLIFNLLCKTTVHENLIYNGSGRATVNEILIYSNGVNSAHIHKLKAALYDYAIMNLGPMAFSNGLHGCIRLGVSLVRATCARHSHWIGQLVGAMLRWLENCTDAFQATCICDHHPWALVCLIRGRIKSQRKRW